LRYSWQGLLDTHDEDTRLFFSGTGVHVKLALRGSDQEKNIIKENVGATNFTHHQVTLPGSRFPGNAAEASGFQPQHSC
jgi:hypothetical protein